MKNITSEMIEEAVNKPYEDISENFFDDFWGIINIVKKL